MRVQRIIRRVLLSAVALAAAALIASLAATHVKSASATSSTVAESASQNWAGYDVTGKHFSSVSGTWTQPQASSNTSSSQGYSAFWVGLGGSSSNSRSLEQVGTASNFVNGHAEFYAWYELVPAGQVRLNLAIHAGDRISAKVAVDGSAVTVSLSDQTTGKSVTKTRHMANPDTSSAEWIAEAPAAKTFGSKARILPLADFGTVTFTNATATADGHSGGISDSQWSATRIQLRSSTSSAPTGGAPPGFAAQQSFAQSTSGATTSTLSGDSFSVAWKASSASGSPATASPTDPAAGPSPSLGLPPGY